MIFTFVACHCVVNRKSKSMSVISFIHVHVPSRFYFIFRIVV